MNELLSTNFNQFTKKCARIVFGKILPRIAFPVLRGPLKGGKFILGTLAGDGGGASVYFNLTEPEQTSVLINTLCEGQVFFDIGANVGYYTILGSRIVGSQGKVIAFEPVIRNLSYLYQHKILNNANNVTIVSAACSDKLSVSMFSAGDNFATGYLASNIHSEYDSCEFDYPVPIITVDALAQILGFTPDVIKIDVEGAEHSVLIGARTTLVKSKPKIFLSTHSDFLRLTCLDYLEELGYAWDVLYQYENTPSEFLAYDPEA